MKEAHSSDIRSRIATLYKNGKKYTDCIFTIDGEQIHCHKLILSTASPVFEAMFYGHFQNESFIEIVDVNAKTFKLMLEFIYTDQIDKQVNEIPSSESSISSTLQTSSNVTIEILIELFYCAEKYLLTDLRKKCLWEIYTKLNYQNILRVLDFTLGADIKPLLDVCLKTLRIIVLTNFEQFRLLSEQTGYHMSKECLQYILDGHKTIFDKSEIDLSIILMVKKWCQIEADERRQQQQQQHTLDSKSVDGDRLEEIIFNELTVPSYQPNNCKQLTTPSLTQKTPMNNNNCVMITSNWDDITNWQSFYRDSYKSAGIVKMYSGETHQMYMLMNHIVAIKSLIVNTRLAPGTSPSYSYNATIPIRPFNSNDRRIPRYSPFQHLINNRCYDEHLIVKFISINTNETICDECFLKKNCEYNSKMFLTFHKPIIMARDQIVKITFTWFSTVNEFILEYPSKLYTNYEQLSNGLSFNFNPNVKANLDNFGNDNQRFNQFDNINYILDGIEYAVLS